MSATPAARAAARPDPAVLLPPAPPASTEDLAELELDVRGVGYRLGLALTDSNPIELLGSGTSTWTLNVADPDGQLLEALADEAGLLDDGVRVELDDVTYVLDGIDPGDEGVLALSMIDEVCWRLEQFDRYISVSRAAITDGQFIKRLLDEASTAASGLALKPIQAFIPEIGERLAIAAPSRRTSRGSASTASGLGNSRIEVKGVRATEAQRQVIEQALAEAQQLGASRRVLIACVMAMTQESDCLRVGHGDAVGPDSRGPYQQRGPWGPLAVRMSADGSTRLFLTANAGPGVQGWKVVHGSLKHGPGDLGAAIAAVQHGPSGSAYNTWLAEATRTVDTWLGTSAGQRGTTYAKPYNYARGSKDGDAENSWEASGRIATEEGRHKRRWACLNVFGYASERELLAAAPSVIITGDEPWLLSRPQPKWGVGRPVTTVTFTVLAARWGVLPNAVVVLAGFGPADGRYLVDSVRGEDPRSPEREITLVRAAAPGTEPAHDEATSSTDSADASHARRVYEAAVRISGQEHPYVYGGGHGVKFSKLKPHDGLDCSSSVCWALQQGGLLDRETALTSGQLMSWGQPGRGRHLSVAATQTHTFLLFEGLGQWVRFDTRSFGENQGRGPHVSARSSGAADLARFTLRHWPGT